MRCILLLREGVTGTVVPEKIDAKAASILFAPNILLRPEWAALMTAAGHINVMTKASC